MTVVDKDIWLDPELRTWKFRVSFPLMKIPHPRKSPEVVLFVTSPLAPAAVPTVLNQQDTENGSVLSKDSSVTSPMWIRSFTSSRSTE